jgi:hypothetical protein
MHAAWQLKIPIVALKMKSQFDATTEEDFSLELILLQKWSTFSCQRKS